jgi:hypothetical protein
VGEEKEVATKPYHKFSKNVYLVKTRSIFQQIMRPQTKLTVSIYVNYLFTPWSRVLLQKLTGFQLVKKFPAFYGTRRLITGITNARHPSLSSCTFFIV